MRLVRRQRAPTGCKPTGRTSEYGRSHVSVGVSWREESAACTAVAFVAACVSCRLGVSPAAAVQQLEVSTVVTDLLM